MRLFQNISIQRKQMLIIMLTTGAALLLVCALFLVFEIVTFRHQMVNDLSTFSGVVGNNVSAALDFDDAKAAAETLSALKAEPNIIGACIYAGDGNLFAEYHRADHSPFRPPSHAGPAGHLFGDDRLQLFRPIISDGESIGTVYLESDMSALHIRLEECALILTGAFALTLFAAFLLSHRLQRWITTPILHLASIAQAVARDKIYSLRAVKEGNDEVAQLIDTFNEMLAQIQARDMNLESQVERRTRELQRENAERKHAEDALRESQALYHSLVEQLPVGIFRKNADGRYVLVNSAFCRLHNITPEHMLGKTPDEVAESAIESEYGRKNLRRGFSHHQQIMRSGQAIEAEEQHHDASGEMRYLDVIKSPVFDLDGRVVGSQGILMDVTRRKQAEADLNRERDLLRALMDGSEDRIYFKDAQSRFLRCSAQMAKRFGVASEAALVGKSDKDFYAGEHANDAFADEQEILRTGRPLIGKVEKETWLDGRVTWALTSKMPLRNENGEIIGTFGISKDITELKLMEEKAAREHARFKLIFDSVPIGISLARNGADGELQERLINDAHLRICGLTREQDGDPAIYKTISHPDDHRRQMELAADILSGKTDHYSVEKRYLRPDGSTVWVLFSFQRRRFPDGSTEDLCTVVDITDSKLAQEEREKLNRQLLDASRQAGMAEVATSVLHNVGNVLNSVNVSSSLISERMRNSKVTNVAKAVALLHQHEKDLGDFLARDPRGRQLPQYLVNLAAHLAQEQQCILEEVAALVNNVVHIKEIVSMQQSYAKSSGILETLNVTDLVEDALRMNLGAMSRHRVNVVRDFAEVPPILTEKHKVLQILINLIRNAKYACDESGREDKEITLRVAAIDGRVAISIHDNGIGIPAENLTRIFNHGFTTRKDGHGFGLHSGAIAAKELGGSLIAASDGSRRGAVFTLELPLHRTHRIL